MEENRVLRIIRGLSLAVVNNLVGRDNGIGMEVKNTEDMNNLVSMRKAILANHITRDIISADILIKNGSVLETITDNDLDNNIWKDIDTGLANAIESDLVGIRDTIIPEANDMVSDLANAIATLSISTYASTMDIRYISRLGITKILMDSELHDYSVTYVRADEPKVLSFPTEEDINSIKSYALIGNPIVDNEINRLLAVMGDDAIITTYNTVMGTLSPELNEYVSDMAKYPVASQARATFIYLILRKFIHNIPFTITGDRDSATRAMKQMMIYLVTKVIIPGNTIHKTLTDANIVIIGKTVSNAICVDIDIMAKNNISAEVLIGANANNITSATTMASDADKYQEVYNSLHALHHTAQHRELITGYIRAYLNVFDKAFDVDATREAYLVWRPKVIKELELYTLPELSDTKTIILMALDVIKYYDSQLIWVSKQLNKYVGGDNPLPFSAASELVALEMVVEYILSNHINIIYKG